MARPKQSLTDEQRIQTIDSDLLGLAEVAELLGTSRRQMARWTARDDFPPPVARLAMGPIWKRADVEKWAKQRKPNGRRKQ